LSPFRSPVTLPVLTRQPFRERSEECAFLGSRSRPGAIPGEWPAEAAHLLGVESQLSTWPKPCRQVRQALGEAVPAGAWLRVFCPPGGVQGRVSCSRRGGRRRPLVRILRPKPGMPVPGARASADSISLSPAGSTEAEQLVQRCQYETVPFPFASWATPETGTSPIPRGV
jgi:hypothetical protein